MAGRSGAIAAIKRSEYVLSLDSGSEKEKEKTYLRTL